MLSSQEKQNDIEERTVGENAGMAREPTHLFTGLINKEHRTPYSYVYPEFRTLSSETV